MSGELQQHAVNAVGEKTTAAIASGGTVATGVSTYLEVIPAVVGSVASIIGILVSCGLFYLAWHKHVLECKHLDLQIQILKRKEREQLKTPGVDSQSD